MTLGEVEALLSGVEAEEVRQWRHTRSVLTLLYNIHAEKGKQKKETEYLPLPGDEDVKSEDAYIPPQIMIERLANTFGLKTFTRKRDDAAANS